MCNTFRALFGSGCNEIFFARYYNTRRTTDDFLIANLIISAMCGVNETYNICICTTYADGILVPVLLYDARIVYSGAIV